MALYGIVLLLAGAAYVLLTKRLIAHHGRDSKLAASIGNDRKGKASVLVYAAAIPLSFVQPWIACACYALVASIWLMPDPASKEHWIRSEQAFLHGCRFAV